MGWPERGSRITHEPTSKGALTSQNSRRQSPYLQATMWPQEKSRCTVGEGLQHLLYTHGFISGLLTDKYDSGTGTVRSAIPPGDLVAQQRKDVTSFES